MGICALLSLLMMFMGQVESQVYNWTVPISLQVTACSGASFLNLSWTYTPTSPAPLSIDWSKLQANGVTTDKAIATDTGTFTPSADYIGRVSKVGNTAEISIQTPGAADEGFYKVTVLDSGGLVLEGGANVTFITPASVKSSGITASSSGSVATCSGLLSHGSPPAALSISYGTFSKTTTTELTINTTVSTKQTVLCSLTGLAADCLTGFRLNNSVEVAGPTPETTLSPTSTTEPPVPPTCDCLPCLIVAAILAGLVIIFILLLCICGAAGAAGAAAGSNSAADRGNVGGKCFKCREDNHRAKTCKAPKKGKSRKLETTVSDLDDRTIEMNLKKHLKTMEIKHIQIDMELGIITVEEREYAQFNIAKKQSQIEIYLYWKDEKMETHHLIFEKKESNKKSDPWRLALFIVSIILIIASLVCLIYPLVGCLPLEGLCVGSVVVSGLGIPLGIVGLLLCFRWRIDGCPWLCCCCIGGYSLANDGNEMREQRSPPPRQPGRPARVLPKPSGALSTPPGFDSAVNPSPRQLPPLNTSARGPPSQPSNVTVGDPANTQSSDSTSASNVKPEVIIEIDHNSATGAARKKRRRKKKKGAGIGSTAEPLAEVDSDGDGHIGKIDP